MSSPLLPAGLGPTRLLSLSISRRLYAADLLTAAIVELDLFTWLDEQPSSLSDTVRVLGIHPRPTDVMLTLFVAMDLLRREARRIG